MTSPDIITNTLVDYGCETPLPSIEAAIAQILEAHRLQQQDPTYVAAVPIDGAANKPQSL